ncbi:PREDICTED: ABI gene family member 3 [Calidris pugnax]|uniref:ABI gene family member 3 n=1 Tax=Calidris pugnax TaxID=198806 RepID=UPI00071CB455|nr:PREDICTED: ABI gene family member 3 [Calidris pugnax]
MSELEQLQQRDIPAGRQVLRDHHCNLLRVADYCESNYLQASDKRKALEETMALTTQSLASVTYQVSSLATAFLRLLDLQAAELRKVEADISCVAQRVDMHKEKVSRREIGSLTVSKRFLSYQKIVPPPNPPSLEPYYRKPLNFSVLDDIGHGIKWPLLPTKPFIPWILGGFVAPDDLEPPPPPALPNFEDLAPPPPPPPAAEDPPWAPENYLEKVVTLYPYTRQKDNELSFQPGTLLFVTRRYSDGWCEGVMGEEAGFFPGNYVEPC